MTVLGFHAEAQWDADAKGFAEGNRDATKNFRHVDLGGDISTKSCSRKVHPWMLIPEQCFY
ncbi:hypothetical protein NIASO_19915 [Niabella soli DSM 19437]|uniref:Uncharacterized protein n=1 Tax=Niabella soli DSM 19437 TaxID=929713 RepID=W0F9C6_9BACT|nr:hypothetical protein NIASO_19915 [Niabella soli DSM 19437]